MVIRAIQIVCFLWLASALDYIKRGAEHAVSQTNLVYIKIPKTGGSTFGGIIRRIGAHNGHSGYADGYWIWKEPGVYANHGRYSEVHPLLDALEQPVFLLSMIRDPAERAISQYYHFEVSKKGQPASTAALIRYMSEIENAQVNQLQRFSGETVQQIVDRYGFIGVTELFDQSAVLMAWRLNVSLGDVLYMSSKVCVPGQIDQVTRKELMCLRRDQYDIELQQYISGSFRSKNNIDYDLYAAVKDAISQEYIASDEALTHQLAEYKRLLASVRTTCLVSAQPCYWGDNGCSYTCLDAVVQSRGIGSSWTVVGGEGT